MPMRKRRHMAVFKGVMMAHAPVVTDATTSGGWIGWMPAKMSPATKAAKPLQRMRLDAVTFILLSFLRLWRSGHLRSPACLLHSTHSAPSSGLLDIRFIARERRSCGLLISPPNSGLLQILFEDVASRHNDRDQRDVQEAGNKSFCTPEAYVRIRSIGNQLGQPKSHNPDGLPHELEEKAATS